MRGIDRLPVLPRVVYEDSQNVHDTTINESIWKNLEVLLNDNPTVSISEHDHDYDYEVIRQRLSPLNPPQEKALQRLYTDRSHFSRRKNAFSVITVTLWNVFLMIWAYAMKEETVVDKEEILGRIREELAEMSGTCATGHLSRLVNVLVGFHPQIEVRISDKDRLRGIFQSVLQAFIVKDNEAEDILCDMINPIPNGVFHRFFLRSQEAMIDEVLDRASITDADEEKNTTIQDLKALCEMMYPSLFLFSLKEPELVLDHSTKSNVIVKSLRRAGTFFGKFLRGVLGN
jgi:hypothetical protein